MPDNAPPPAPGWVPAARLATILAGVAAFVGLLWLYNFGSQSKAFWLLGLGILLYALYALHQGLRRLERGGEPERWYSYPLAPVREASGATTPATFVPDRLWGIQKLSAPSIMLLLFGLSLTAIGVAQPSLVKGGIGALLLVVAFWTNPREQRGIWHGKCPHCGEALSAFKHARQLECPQCEHPVLLADGRFQAI